MLGRVVACQRLRCDDEVHRDHVRSLMQELKERVLRVRARLAKDHRRRCMRDRGAIRTGLLAVRLHFELLKKGGEPRQPLAVGDDRNRAASLNIATPDTDQGEKNRQIVRQRRLREMAVHLGGAAQKRLEFRPTDRNRQRQPHRGPERETPADPFRNREDPLGRDTELCCAVQARGHGDRMRGPARAKPLTRGHGIRNRLARGEALGGKRYQRACRVEAA